ncbi:hypothetical protein DPEC_G00289160 [Dallia pectoralis]|uniref:Uncharacterized protein n=1 Tax=Dallia pectoralis TaxID=75939 RepID=A0ACC2FKM5_DALPE|nr:hypothetical protein DPEC_G00289160 [Dallia pectoralis]
MAPEDPFRPGRVALKRPWSTVGPFPRYIWMHPAHVRFAGLSGLSGITGMRPSNDQFDASRRKPMLIKITDPRPCETLSSLVSGPHKWSAICLRIHWPGRAAGVPSVSHSQHSNGPVTVQSQPR